MPPFAGIAQLARASRCHREGRGFESLCPLFLCTAELALLQFVVVENDFFLAVTSTHFHVFLDNAVAVGIE